MKSIVRVGLVFAGLACVGCGIDTTIPHTGQAHQSSTRSLVAKRVEVPRGLNADAVTPRQDNGLLRAQLSLEQVLGQLQRPDYLPVEMTSRVTNQVQRQQPPLAAQHAYRAGRQAWRSGKNFEAIKHLQSALGLSPNSAAILRLLGKIYTRSGNRIRGAIYLEKAVSADPSDADSLFMLGRLLGEQGRWSHAITTFAFAGSLDVAASDPTLGLLLQYHLGHALDHEGYDTAAITQLTAYLTRPLGLDRTTGRLRHLMLLGRQRWATWQTLGDAYNRLDRPADALAAYQQASQKQDVPEDGLVRRLVYTCLRLGQSDLALAAVEQHIQRVGGDSVLLDLVHYLSEYGVENRRLVVLLRKVYDSGQRSSSLVLTIANLLDAQHASELLTAHVRAQPGERAVFEKLVELEMTATPVDQDRVRRILETTILLIDLLPSAAEEYTTLLVAASGDGAVLVDAIDAMETFAQSEAAIRLIKSKALVRIGRVDDAIGELEKVTKGNPHWQAAAIELARLLVNRRELDRADELLDSLPAAANINVVKLRLGVLLGRGDAIAAVRFLDELLAQHPANGVQLAIEKANLQLKLGDALQAHMTLQKTLRAYPRSASLYEQLILLYRSKRLSDSEKHYASLVRQMFNTIPHERVARVERARIWVNDRQYDQAEPLLRALLAQDPDRLEPLDPLLELLVDTDRAAEAEAMINDRVKAAAANRHILSAALRYYRRVADRAKIVEIAKRLMLLLFQDRPKEFGSISVLMEILVDHGQQEMAQMLLEAQLTQEPDDRSLLMSALRHYKRMGNKERSFEVTEKLLLLGESDTAQVQALAQLYITHERPQEAIDVLQKAMHDPGKDATILVALLSRALVQMGRDEEADQHYRSAIEQFPKQASDLRYAWAMHYERAGNWPRSQQVLLELLEARPTHAMANNALGYAWAIRGENLDRAEKMIRVAVKADGDSAPYLDSLGWVLYKQGRFDDAIIWLQRGAAAPRGDYPVILDHLGDVLYRVGQAKSAVNMWRRAQTGMGQHDPAEDRELQGLAQRLLEKIRAVEAEEKPQIAEVPGLQLDGDEEQPGQAAVKPNHEAVE